MGVIPGRDGRTDDIGTFTWSASMIRAPAPSLGTTPTVARPADRVSRSNEGTHVSAATPSVSRPPAMADLTPPSLSARQT